MMMSNIDFAAAAPAGTGAGYGIAPAGYRLPAETHVGRVRLQVADLERSLAWYGRVLGMRVLARADGTATLGTRGDDALVELSERPGAAPVPHRGRLGLYHYAILLPDRAALGRFVTHLGQAGERFGASDHRVSEATYLHDPDGLGIEVYADRPREAWEASGRELRMDTTPMDLRGVMAAAKGEPWTGMPAGTVVGHVHLHVGALDRAAEFYHAALGLDAVGLSRRALPFGRRLSPPPGAEHLGRPRRTLARRGRGAAAGVGAGGPRRGGRAGGGPQPGRCRVRPGRRRAR